MGRSGRGRRRKVDFLGRNTETERASCFCLPFCSEGEDSSVGNQDYSPSPLGTMHVPGLPGSPEYCPAPSLGEGGHVCFRAARFQTCAFLCNKTYCKIFLPLVSSVRSLLVPHEGSRTGKAVHSCSSQGQHRSDWDQVFPRYPQQLCLAQIPLHTLHFSVRAIALGQIFSRRAGIHVKPLMTASRIQNIWRANGRIKPKC